MRIAKNTTSTSPTSWNIATRSRLAMKFSKRRAPRSRLRLQVEEEERVVRVPGDAGELVGGGPFGLGLDQRDPGEILLQRLLDLRQQREALPVIHLDLGLGEQLV